MDLPPNQDPWQQSDPYHCCQMQCTKSWYWYVWLFNFIWNDYLLRSSRYNWKLGSLILRELIYYIFIYLRGDRFLADFSEMWPQYDKSTTIKQSLSHIVQGNLIYWVENSLYRNPSNGESVEQDFTTLFELILKQVQITFSQETINYNTLNWTELNLDLLPTTIVLMVI